MPKVSTAHEQARREQILTAAATCFARSGFASTSVPEIVSEAGLSVGSIYRYFASKEDLFLAVVADRVAVYNDAVFAELSRKAPVVKRLMGALRRLQRLLLDHAPEDARLSLELWARAHDVAGLREWLVEARSRRLEALQQVLRQGKMVGELRPDLHVDDAAAALVALADGLVVQRACSPFLSPAGSPLTEAERLVTSWRWADAELASQA